MNRVAGATLAAVPSSGRTAGALFVAAGPAFRQGVTAAPFRNIHIYDLVAGILGLTPAPNDGSPDSTATLLRDTRTLR